MCRKWSKFWSTYMPIGARTTHNQTTLTSTSCSSLRKGGLGLLMMKRTSLNSPASRNACRSWCSLQPSRYLCTCAGASTRVSMLSVLLMPPMRFLKPAMYFSTCHQCTDAMPLNCTDVVTTNYTAQCKHRHAVRLNLSIPAASQRKHSPLRRHRLSTAQHSKP